MSGERGLLDVKRSDGWSQPALREFTPQLRMVNVWFTPSDVWNTGYRVYGLTYIWRFAPYIGILKYNINILMSVSALIYLQVIYNCTALEPYATMHNHWIWTSLCLNDVSLTWPIPHTLKRCTPNGSTGMDNRGSLALCLLSPLVLLGQTEVT